MDVNISSEFQKALHYEQQGDLASAKKCYENILAIDPKHELTLHGLGIIYAQSGDIKTAQSYFEMVLEVNPRSDSAYSNLGNCYTELGDLVKAKKYFEQALAINANLSDAHYNLGNTLFKLNRLSEAIGCYTNTININPNFADAYFNLANCCLYVGRYKDALDNYRKIEQVYEGNSRFCFGIGCTYCALRNFKQSLFWINKAVKIKEVYPEAYNELGRVHSILGNDTEAVTYYSKAHTQDVENETYLYNLVVVHTRLKDFTRAYSYAKMLKISTERFALLHYLISVLCDWDNYKQINASILSGELLSAVTAWDYLRISDSAELQYNIARALTEKNFPMNLSLGHNFKLTKNPKIKIGYFSPDFRNHAVMHLAAEIFQKHNRDRFEVHAFSMHPKHTAEEKNNLSNYFDYLHEINELADVSVVEMARHIGIDIAVDLTGNTRDLRTGIFALRAAPVQVNFLGYTGTMGASYYEYIIADPVVIPAEHQPFYGEKIVYLNSFMPRQVNLLPSHKSINRLMYGLPQEGFVFCCFNKSFKFNPEVFESWLNILKSVPMSVLWFNGQHAETVQNLKKFTAEKQIDPSRLIFSDPVIDMSEHLGRHRLAGLFLDTYPYNAHTTASDALWSGLPVLTRIGNSFASRVAASLLTALDLPELITHSIKEYENLAIYLANNPQRLTELKSKLRSNLKTKRLFDMKNYMREYENALTVMYQRAKNDDLPSNIDVSSAQSHG